MREGVEPTYQYVKGKGWVATTNPEPEVESLRATLRCGTSVILLQRMPKLGERFGAYNNESLERWAQHCAAFSWDEFRPLRENEYLMSAAIYTTMVLAP